MQRKPTFLASEEWLTVPWHGDATPKNILHRLLDVVVSIPAYLSKIDEFSAFLNEGTRSPTELLPLQSSIWESAQELGQRLQQWESEDANKYSVHGVQEKVDIEGEDEFPVFQCQDIQTMEIIRPAVFAFPDLLLAMSMCFYWATRLILSAADPGIVNTISLEERYQLACNICRSVKYYVLNIPGCLVSRLMFVLRVAFETFADGTVEKAFVTELFTYIGVRFRFPVFLNQCSSLVARDREEVKPEDDDLIR